VSPEEYDTMLNRWKKLYSRSPTVARIPILLWRVRPLCWPVYLASATNRANGQGGFGEIDAEKGQSAGYGYKQNPPRVRNFVTRIAVEMQNVFKISTAIH